MQLLLVEGKITDLLPLKESTRSREDSSEFRIFYLTVFVMHEVKHTRKQKVE